MSEGKKGNSLVLEATGSEGECSLTVTRTAWGREWDRKMLQKTEVVSYDRSTR